MNDDDSDKDRKKQSLLSLGTPASESAVSRVAGPPPAGSEADDPVARHRLARSRRESKPSPLLSALAAMEGFKTEPVSPEPDAGPAPEPDVEPLQAERPASRWSLRDLLSPKLKYDKPQPRPAGLSRQPIRPASEAPAAESSPERPIQPEPPRETFAGAPAADDTFERPEPAIVIPPPPSEDTRWQPLIDPLKVIGGIGSSKSLIVASTVIGGLIGVALALSTPKKYESIAELLVDPRDLKISDRELTQTGLPSDATLALVENQVRVITSGTVLNEVVNRLKLYEDPEFNGQRQGAGIGDVIAGLRALLSGGQSGGGDDRRHALAVSNLAESLHVERAGKTFIVTVSARSEDPEKSATIVNTVNDVFLKTTGELQSDTAGRAADELSSRLDELRASLEEAERKAEQFRAEHDLIDAQGRLISDDELVKLNDQLAIARARTIELNARAASARSVRVDSVIGGALPEALSSPVMSELRSQYAAINQQADQLSVRLGPRHPQYLAMQAQLDGARRQIGTELQRIVASVQTELKRAVQQEQDLAARLAQLKVRATDVNSDLVTMRELEREAAAKRAVYENYLLRAREAGEQRDINTANISVISPAYPPLESTGPSRATIALGGAALGFVFGVGLGMARGIFSSLREAGRTRRRPRPLSAMALQAYPGTGEGSGSDLPGEGPAAPAATGPAPRTEEAPEEAAVNPLVRLMQRFRSPTVVAGGDPSVPPDSASDRAVEFPAHEKPANEEPEPMYPYPQQPPVYPQQASAQPSEPAAPVYPYGVPYPPHTAQPAPYMPQQPLPPYPPAFVQPQHYAPHFAPQPAAYPYAPPQQPPQPAFHGWQPPPGPVTAYGYPQQPVAAAYPAYQAPSPAYHGQPAIQPVPPAPAAAREMSPLEEVRESLREFRQAIRDLAEDRARRRYS